MPIAFNHTIIAAHDKRASASFISELFGLPDPVPFGPFMTVEVEHGATLDYADVADGEQIRPQHSAGPGGRRPGEINTRDGGRGVCFPDPAGHSLEIITRPYGSGG